MMHGAYNVKVGIDLTVEYSTSIFVLNESYTKTILTLKIEASLFPNAGVYLKSVGT